MAREIYIVTAHIVDVNGTYNPLSGYPKIFDSKNYSGDVAKAYKRAEGDFSECWGAMCKRDDRMIQTVTLELIDGYQIDRKSSGSFPIDTSNSEVEE